MTAWLGWSDLFGYGTDGHLDLPLFVGGVKHGEWMQVPADHHFTVVPILDPPGWWLDDRPEAAIAYREQVYRRVHHRPCFDAELMTFHAEETWDEKAAVAGMWDLLAVATPKTGLEKR